MPIDRVGIGPARPCMLMCERTSVSPLPVSASSVQRDIYAQSALGCLSDASPRSEHACERVHTRVWQVRAPVTCECIWKNFCQTYDSLFNPLSLSFYFDFLSRASLEKKSKSNEAISRRQSYIQLLLDYIFCTGSDEKIMRIFDWERKVEKRIPNTRLYIIHNFPFRLFKICVKDWSNLKFLFL